MEEEYRMQKNQGDDQASTRGIKAPSSTMQPISIADANSNDDEPPSAVPRTRISTESSRGNSNEDGQKEIEKPAQVAGEGEQNEASPALAQELFSFSNKKLCERWLDNLFMVLYEVGIFLALSHLRSFNNRLT